MKKILTCLVSVCCLAAAARAQSAGGAPKAELWKTKVFTAEELKKYDGTGGMPAYAGAGLVFAGITDTCGLALLLAKMPWNACPRP